MRMAAEGTIPVVVTVQHRGEASSLLGDQNRDPPPDYNTIAVAAAVNEIQSKKKRKKQRMSSESDWNPVSTNLPKVVYYFH